MTAASPSYPFTPFSRRGSAPLRMDLYGVRTESPVNAVSRHSDLAMWMGCSAYNLLPDGGGRRSILHEVQSGDRDQPRLVPLCLLALCAYGVMLVLGFCGRG